MNRDCISRIARTPPDCPFLTSTEWFLCFALLASPTNMALFHLGWFLPASPPLLAFFFEMADEPIYYLLSNRAPCLEDSGFYLFYFTFVVSALTCYPTELRQRDWLVDMQVYVKIFNIQELRMIINNVAQNPCASATLLLASLLRVSLNFTFSPKNLAYHHQPNSNHYPLYFRPDSLENPHIFYTIDFKSRHLPPPTEDSFGFSVLFAYPIESRSTLFTQLARFFLHVSADIRSVADGVKLWELTFWVDNNHVFGTLQFETRDRHQKLEIEGFFYTNSLIATDPNTKDVIFYRDFAETSVPDRAVFTYMGQIREILKYVLRRILHIFCSTPSQGTDQTRGYIPLAKSARFFVNLPIML